MFNEQLEKLIEMALLDGELTEKEKQVLFKKAEAFGVDLDEFEMVLDARLFEQTQKNKEAGTQSFAAPKSDKYGDIRKCPACGSIVNSSSAKCLDCGHEFSNIEANASIQKLFKMLNDAENERVEESGGFLSTVGSFYSKGLGMSSFAKVDSKKMEIIANFPIPSTKNDILEFLSLAIPRSRSVGNWLTKDNGDNKLPNAYAAIWKAKCEEIIMKARFSLKDDKATMEQINQYGKEIGIK